MRSRDYPFCLSRARRASPHGLSPNYGRGITSAEITRPESQYEGCFTLATPRDRRFHRSLGNIPGIPLLSTYVVRVCVCVRAPAEKQGFLLIKVNETLLLPTLSRIVIGIKATR